MTVRAVAMYLQKRGVVRLRRGPWSDEFSADALAGRIAFYRGLCERRNGAVEKFYRPTLDALVEVQKTIKEKDDV